MSAQSTLDEECIDCKLNTDQNEHNLISEYMKNKLYGNCKSKRKDCPRIVDLKNYGRKIMKDIKYEEEITGNTFFNDNA